MAKKVKEKVVADLSTEEKIKEAARVVFTRKGYAATRTRDIAEEAGLNLALLNYYFRSKEKLFQQVMIENVQKLFSALLPVINDANSKLEVKIEFIVSAYLDLLAHNPDLPLFVLTEIRNDLAEMKSKLPLEKVVKGSVLIQQFKEKRPDIDPFHFLLNLLALSVFPFVGKPLFMVISGSDDNNFNKMMEERRQLIPVWIKAMLKAK
ncbi:TetR/AcrR family transcriptional regulator [Chitinophagaceae bacterium MMS25-I14]